MWKLKLDRLIKISYKKEKWKKKYLDWTLALRFARIHDFESWKFG